MCWGRSIGIHVSPDPNHPDIVAQDDSGVLTSLERQQNLFDRGFQFEAAISRAALVEGLLVHYLIVAEKVRGVAFDEATRKRIREERMTFGQVKDALKAAGAFHDQSLVGPLEAFIQQRNQMAHHMVSGRRAFDLPQFFQEGRSLAFLLWEHLSPIVREALARAGVDLTE